jgi:hypothetical protein
MLRSSVSNVNGKRKPDLPRRCRMTGLRHKLMGLAFFLAGIAVGGLIMLAWEEHQAASRRWEATAYVPLVDNDGKPFAESEWQEALHVLVSDFGGATVGPPQEGWWLDDGRQVHREPVRPVTVSFERSRLADFRRSIRAVGQRLGQQEMYVRLEEPRIEVLPVASGLPGKER